MGASEIHYALTRALTADPGDLDNRTKKIVLEHIDRIYDSKNLLGSRQVFHLQRIAEHLS